MNAGVEGFAQFVVARERSLLRTAWLLTGDWALAEDLVQTALVRSWPRWESKSREPTSAMAVNESGLGSSADGKGEEGIDRSFERTGIPKYLGE